MGSNNYEIKSGLPATAFIDNVDNMPTTTPEERAQKFLALRQLVIAFGNKKANDESEQLYMTFGDEEHKYLSKLLPGLDRHD